MRRRFRKAPYRHICLNNPWRFVHSLSTRNRSIRTWIFNNWSLLRRKPEGFLWIYLDASFDQSEKTWYRLDWSPFTMYGDRSWSQMYTVVMTIHRTRRPSRAVPLFERETRLWSKLASRQIDKMSSGFLLSKLEYKNIHVLCTSQGLFRQV